MMFLNSYFKRAIPFVINLLPTVTNDQSTTYCCSIQEFNHKITPHLLDDLKYNYAIETIYRKK